MTMTHKKNAWIAVISFALALTAFGAGKSAAGGDMQIEGIGKMIVKGFGAVDFPGPDWKLADRDQKKGHSDYKCNGDEGCHFFVEFESVNGCLFETQQAAGSSNGCMGDFIAEPQGPGIIVGPVNGTYAGFHCEKGAVVTTFNDLLWIPETCYPDIADD
jgi:hypothetical protein